MLPEELAALKEALRLADEAHSILMEVDNEHVRHVGNMLYSATWLGEKIINGKIK